MDATEFFVYTASIAVLILLVLFSLAFYFFYRTMVKAQMLINSIKVIVDEVHLFKLNKAIAGYKAMHTILRLVRGKR
jgi:hypothetical protein